MLPKAEVPKAERPKEAPATSETRSGGFVPRLELPSVPFGAGPARGNSDREGGGPSGGGRARP